MKSRQEIKAIARDAMRRQRGTAILLILLPMLVGMIIGMISAISSVLFLATIVGLFAYLIIAWSGAAIAQVLQVNVIGEFIKLYKGEYADAGATVSNLGVNFWRKLGGTMWMALWITLWSLLLIIPGFIKMFSYWCTMNILADCPNVTAREALKISMRITRGHKLDIFIFVLSFFGWFILSAFTFGIVGIIFANPYFMTADAGLYVELRQKALDEGRITYEELGMKPPVVDIYNVPLNHN